MLERLLNLSKVIKYDHIGKTFKESVINYMYVIFSIIVSVTISNVLKLMKELK